MNELVKATMNAAYRLDADAGMARMEKLAKMLETEFIGLAGYIPGPDGNVPAIGDIGLVVMVALLVVAGAVVLARRQRTA